MQGLTGGGVVRHWRKVAQILRNAPRAVALAGLGLVALLFAACGQLASSSEETAGVKTAALTGKGVGSKAPVAAPPAATGPKTVWIMLRQQPSLSAAKATKDWKARGQAVYQALTTNAQSAQASLVADLTSRGIAHQTFWIVNAVKVTADQGVIDGLSKRADVAKILPDKIYQIPPIKHTTGNSVQTTEWGLEAIGASRVWQDLGVFGDGIVVGSVDTGVEYTHPALVQQYRGSDGNGGFDHNYNWFDPSGVCGSPANGPCDNVAHGTHTVGTMVGDDHAGNQIGVAPHARWIAAKGCESFGCSFGSLVAAGQWMLAPTDLNGQNPRSDLRPHVVNNSWGGGPGDDFYRPIVEAWVAAGMFPAFAAGNAGPSCGSAGSPGDYDVSFAVGAFDIGGRIASFSSRGPSLGGLGKPNLAGPGVSVRSSVPGGGYDIFDGTSMATPHLAGTVALLWSGSEALVRDVETTRALLDSTAVDVDDMSCGGLPGNNNVWGEGRLDAFAAVDQSPRGPTGTLSGHILADGAPVVRARIVADDGQRQRNASSDATGAYSLRLPVGTYTVGVTAFGYLAQAATVTITQDQTTPSDFALVAAPSFGVSGHARDGAGQPLAGATITIDGTPLAPTTTAADGSYSFASVPAGSYGMRAELVGCFEAQSAVLDVDSTEVLDFVLPARVDGFGYSCKSGNLPFVEATNQLALSGDDAATTVTLPFPFAYYGRSYQQASVSTNGFVAFEGNSTSYSNVPIPDPSEPNAAVFAFWDDLFVNFNSGVFTETVGAAPNRRFVIEWRDVELLGQQGTPLTFSVTLYESGEVALQYRTLGATPEQRGGSATAGIEDPTGTVGLQYGFDQALLTQGLSVLYTAPPYALVSGRVVDANDSNGLGGVQVQAAAAGSPTRSTQTDASGNYRLSVPVGTVTLTAGAPRYSSAQVTLVTQDRDVLVQDFRLQTSKVSLTGPTLKWLVPVGQTRQRVLSLSNVGSSNLTFEVKESGGARQSVVATRGLARNPVANGLALNTRSLFKAGVQASGMNPTAVGDVLFSFTTPTLQSAWGVGYTGKLWLGEFLNRQNHELNLDGSPTGRQWPAPGISEGVADMAFDAARNLVCQVAVGGDNGIHCFNPNTGVEADSIVGAFPWTGISQRGLAYRSDDDSFYIAGWNEGIVYHVAGLGSPNKGQVLGSCMPPDGNISGLGWNASAGVLWAATNSPQDTIYELDPTDCTIMSALPHPSAGFSGAGLEVDDAGNLWMIGQSTSSVYLVDSGVPAFADVSWLSVTPTTGTLAPGNSQNLKVNIDSTGLAAGQYLATLTINSNAGREPSLRIPVSLVVTDYQRAINVGADPYTDSQGEPWVADQKYASGGWGFFQKGSTASTTHAIAGTSDQALYKAMREDPYAYRFDNVPNGIYEVDLRFAEIAKLGKKRRVFDVVVEDTLVLPAHDVEYDVGRFAAQGKLFFVEVTDQRLDVRFIARAGFEKPMLNALRVTRRTDK